MSKIQQIIEEAIGEDKPQNENVLIEEPYFTIEEIGYNKCLADLRAKAPDIEKKIIEEIEKKCPDRYLDVEEATEPQKELNTTLREIIINLAIIFFVLLIPLQAPLWFVIGIVLLDIKAFYILKEIREHNN